MDILCDNPAMLKAVLGEEYHVKYSPDLAVYTQDNMILKTLKGMFFSSKLDFENEDILQFIKDTAKPADLKEPICHTCYNYNDFDKFCKEFIDNCDGTVKIAYDVETTAAPYLSNRYKLAGFSLASSSDEGCYVILDSIDYTNPDKDKTIQRLAEVIKNHSMLVFNAQHEYIATNICVGVNLREDSVHLDDAYSMALLLKTESFRPDVFKLKLLCNRLLGVDNWATVIDDYIELTKGIAREEKFDFSHSAELTESQKEKLIDFRDMLYNYGYNSNEVVSFIKKIQDSYDDWKEQDTIPYSLIPSKMISKYGCYDSCYLLALFDYLESWAKELNVKLADSLNVPNIELAYEETIDGQIMSAILTLNGLFLSEERDNEVKEKSRSLAEKYYNKLWDITSDSFGTGILKEFVQREYKNIIEKTYVLPYYIEQLIPEGFRFIKTTPTFYSFECEGTDIEAIKWAEEEQGLKPCDKTGTHFKLLQKHLLPYETLPNLDDIIREKVDDFLADSIKKDGTLSKSVFKLMSGPKTLFDILNEDLKYSRFMSRVVLYEYKNLPEKLKDKSVTEFLEHNLLYDFDNDVERYERVAKTIKPKVLDYIKKTYSYKQVYDNLLKEGLKSFAAPIIAYIYTIYTTTGCSIEEPKHSAFNFICQLKISRKYQRIISTFIKGASGGYSIQMKVNNDSINSRFLTLNSTKVTDENGVPIYNDYTSNVVFGKWFANVAETGRWTATIHNVPAGAYCKRRFVSRFSGGVIMAADMSQMEVRELAVLSKCEKLINTIKNPNIDIHKNTAHLAFDVPYDEVTPTQRKQTKEGIFSVVYGRELESLAQNLFKGDKQAAQRLMDAIFKVYPEIPEYLHNALSDAKKHGYVVTRRGAPIYVNPYTEKDNNIGEQAFKRTVQNYPIQGGASYICTNTLYNIQKLIDKYNMKTKIVCYIHDSIELDVPPEEIDLAYKVLYSAFNVIAAKKYGVPCKGDVCIGVSMGEELGFDRIEANTYKVSGNIPDIKDLLDQFSLNYDVDILEYEESDEVKENNSLDWAFTPRAEFVWNTKIQKGSYTIKLSEKK